MTYTDAPRSAPRRAPKARPGRAARRFGYLVALAVNVAMLYAVNRWPGWDAVSFLTDDMSRVVDWVNASIVVGIGANVVYFVRDPRWLKALGDLLTTTIGIVVLVRLWQVFPFDFPDGSVDWALIARIVLVVGIAGSAIGIIAALVSFVRAVAGPSGPTMREP
jgi:hypothetical protein